MTGALAGWVAFLLLIAARPIRAAEPRFFFAGDGSLALDNAHFGEHLAIRYRAADGHYDPAALAAIEHFFRSRSDGRSGRVSLRLIELIDFIQDRYRPARMTLISGYRSPELNAALRGSGHRVAQASLHTEGMAADLQFSGLDMRRLWLALRTLETGGVGLYAADGFIHVDTGTPRFWEAATSGVEKNLSAGNARVFARTDFDRYADLRGAMITLHAVTALPIRIRRTASVGGRALALEPSDASIARDGDCYVVAQPAAAYAFTVTTSDPGPAQRAPIRLSTCPPRIEATPAEIETNPIQHM
jgi:uncharacterized protein YcbK (DUF882 family)